MTKKLHLLKFLPFLFAAFFATIATAQPTQRNCGSMDLLDLQLQKSPEMWDKMEAMERHSADFLNQLAHLRNAERVITIPIVVHIVYRTQAENISDAQIQSQIDVLNRDFRKLNGDATRIPYEFQQLAADCNLQFALAKRTPDGQPTNGITRTHTQRAKFGVNDEVKFSKSSGINAWQSTDYLNIWICNLSGEQVGYSQFPGGEAATDGVVIDYRCFGTMGAAKAPFHLGRTATHEIGHWLNLRHIWGDMECGDDRVEDTPQHKVAHFGCHAGAIFNTCKADGSYTREMPMNFMDYSDDECMSMFTKGQKDRMRSMFAAGGFRESILKSKALQPIETRLNVATDAQKAILNGDFLNVFPNPTSYTTTIAFENDGKGTHDIVICSLTGEVVQRIDAVAVNFGKLTQTTISVSELPSGVYMVMIFYNGQRWQTRKLVIAHQSY